jgi:hypothetical protein
MDIIYIETSIVSHATARPSADIQIAAIQHQARQWWAIERPNFELVTSQLVIDEASAGDPWAAAERLKLLDGLPLVSITMTSERWPVPSWPPRSCRQRLLQTHFTLPLPQSREYNTC